jgi:hypothetical protein
MPRIRAGMPRIAVSASGVLRDTGRAKYHLPVHRVSPFRPGSHVTRPFAFEITPGDFA